MTALLLVVGSLMWCYAAYIAAHHKGTPGVLGCAALFVGIAFALYRMSSEELGPSDAFGLTLIVGALFTVVFLPMMLSVVILRRLTK